MSKVGKEVLKYLKSNDIESLKKVVNESDVVDLLDIMRGLLPKERVLVFRLLNKTLALQLFEALDPLFQQELLESFSDERVKELIKELTVDQRVRLFEELPASVVSRLTKQLSIKSEDEIAYLMGYEHETAGRIMTPEYVRLTKDMTVKKAMEHAEKEGKSKDFIYTLYVTDKNKKLEGVVSLRELILAEEETKIKDIMTTEIMSVQTDTDQEEVVEKLKDFDILAMPVVDLENRLVGLVSIDRAIHIMEEEVTEDILDKAGIGDINRLEADRSDVLIYGNLWSIWKVRLPFLIVTLLGGMLAGGVVEMFEETLQAVAAIAIFIPVIMDMGGNAGTQSTTIFSRALILGQINTRFFKKYLIKETLVGLSMGILSGITAGAIALFWQGDASLAIAVGCSLAITMTLATTLGFIIPFTLIKMGLDQAAGSDPIITTIKDVTGLLIYFVLVTVLM